MTETVTRAWLLERVHTRNAPDFVRPYEMVGGAVFRIPPGPEGIDDIWLTVRRDYKFELLNAAAQVIAEGRSSIDGDPGPLEQYAERGAHTIRYPGNRRSPVVTRDALGLRAPTRRWWQRLLDDPAAPQVMIDHGTAYSAIVERHLVEEEDQALPHDLTPEALRRWLQTNKVVTEPDTREARLWIGPGIDPRNVLEAQQERGPSRLVARALFLGGFVHDALAHPLYIRPTQAYEPGNATWSYGHLALVELVRLVQFGGPDPVLPRNTAVLIGGDGEWIATFVDTRIAP